MKVDGPGACLFHIGIQSRATGVLAAGGGHLHAVPSEGRPSARILALLLGRTALPLMCSRSSNFGPPAGKRDRCFAHSMVLSLVQSVITHPVAMGGAKQKGVSWCSSILSKTSLEGDRCKPNEMHLRVELPLCGQICQ